MIDEIPRQKLDSGGNFLSKSREEKLQFLLGIAPPHFAWDRLENPYLNFSISEPSKTDLAVKLPPKLENNRPTLPNESFMPFTTNAAPEKVDKSCQSNSKLHIDDLKNTRTDENYCWPPNGPFDISPPLCGKSRRKRGKKFFLNYWKWLNWYSAWQLYYLENDEVDTEVQNSKKKKKSKSKKKRSKTLKGLSKKVGGISEESDLEYDRLGSKWTGGILDQSPNIRKRDTSIDDYLERRKSEIKEHNTPWWIALDESKNADKNVEVENYRWHHKKPGDYRSERDENSYKQ